MPELKLLLKGCKECIVFKSKNESWNEIYIKSEGEVGKDDNENLKLKKTNFVSCATCSDILTNRHGGHL